MAERSPLEQWIAAQVPSLLDRAQRGALEEAEAALRRELTDQLLQAARAHVSAQRRRPAGAPAGTVLWVYGVVPDGREPPRVQGIEARPVEPVVEAGLAALTSALPAESFTAGALEERLEDLKVVEALARAHEQVLEAALRDGDVIPFRLCTLHESVGSVRRMLADEAPVLRAALERLGGKAEWGVKAFLAPQRREPAAAAASASGTEYLVRRREQRDAVERAEEAAEAAVAGIHARLAERASAAAIARPQDRRLTGRDDEMVLNGAYLVPRDGADAFAALVDELRSRYLEQGLTLELTGPWPPYHFVAEEER